MNNNRKETPSHDIPMFLEYRNRTQRNTLIKALTIAFIIHLLFFFFFTIKTATFTEKINLPAIAVAAHMNTIHSTTSVTSTQTTAYGMLKQHLIKPKPPTPELHKPQITAPLLRSDTLRAMCSCAPCFNHLAASPPSISLPSIQITNYDPITVILSGTLADLKMTSNGLSSIALPTYRADEFTHHSVAFAIQLENKKGEIFWSERKSSAPTDQLNKVAEDILRAIQFEPSNSGFITTGTIEIIFTI